MRSSLAQTPMPAGQQCGTRMSGSTEGMIFASIAYLLFSCCSFESVGRASSGRGYREPVQKWVSADVVQALHKPVHRVIKRWMIISAVHKLLQ
eukprot:2858640-Rhodomonas_salina.1